jgi:hypothetical protein
MCNTKCEMKELSGKNNCEWHANIYALQTKGQRKDLVLSNHSDLKVRLAQLHSHLVITTYFLPEDKIPVSSERLVPFCKTKWRHSRKYGNPSVKSPYDVKRNAWKSQYVTSNSMKGIHTERGSQGVSCLWTEIHNKLKVDWFIASRERKLINL